MKIFLEEIPNHNLEDLYELSSKERVTSSKRYKTEHDKKKHLLGDVLLREALEDAGEYRDSVIKTDKFGKPYVDIKDFYFNISHSKDVIVIGYSRIADVGIDIEYIKERDLSFAERLLHPKEVEYLKNSKDKLKDFYRVWTLKESYVKALGKGLLIDLKSFYSIPGEYSVNAKFNQTEHEDYIISTAEIMKK